MCTRCWYECMEQDCLARMDKIWIAKRLQSSCHVRYDVSRRLPPSKNQLKTLVMSLPQMYAEIIDFHSIDTASITDALKLIHSIRSKIANLQTFNGFRFKKDQVNYVLTTKIATVIVFDRVDFGSSVAKNIAIKFADWTIFFGFHRLYAINAHIRRKSDLRKFSIPRYNLSGLWPMLVELSIR